MSKNIMFTRLKPKIMDYLDRHSNMIYIVTMIDNKLTSDLLRGHTDTIILKFLAGGDNAPRRWIDSADNFTVGRVFRADSAVGEANGAFIVRAVNSHEALVKALEGLVEWVWEDNRGDELAPLDEARAALQKAREESK